MELVIGLLMFIGVELKEHTYYDSLSACLKAKEFRKEVLGLMAQDWNVNL